jgi:hypothetical protein
VKELKKGDCHKKKGGDQVKRFKNKCWKSPEKTETHSDGSLISFTAEQIRGPQQQVLYSSSTHKKGEREKNFLSN